MSGKKPKTIMRIFRRISRLHQGQRGLGLAETLVAVAILGTAVTAFIAALSAASIAVGAQDEDTTAQALASSQLEYTKSYTYDAGAASYPSLSTPEGYELTVAVSPVPGTDTDIQKITVTVSRDDQDVLTVADYKVNR
jgi:Tfp pilus assembly protein PilV